MRTTDHDDMKSALMQYRLKKAREEIADAEALIEHGSYASANNRIYYAMFHVLLAVHALDERETRTHKATLGAFNQFYLHTSIFDPAYWKKIARIVETRHSSDYDDFYLPDDQETRSNLTFVKDFFEEVKDYCEERIGASIDLSDVPK